MKDAILTPEDRKEGLSRGYVQVVAAAAGYTLAEQNFDRDGVDLQVRAGGALRPSLDLQLKATARLARVGTDWRFDLPKRNYDLLRERTLVPRILVVLNLPAEEGDWLSISEEELVLRRCAYWADITDAPESDNERTVTISIPEHNRFDADALKRLMDRARKGPLS